MLKLRPKETASMLTTDSLRLDADIYRPDAAGEFPVLLMRQPYGRAIASTVVYSHPAWYANTATSLSSKTCGDAALPKGSLIYLLAKHKTVLIPSIGQLICREVTAKSECTVFPTKA